MPPLRSLLVCFALALPSLVCAETPRALPPLPLWPDGAPGALGTDEKDIPTLTAFLPDPAKATGAAFVICPGGGYAQLADHEGAGYARWLAEHGVAGLVLKYRLSTSGYHHPTMFQDGTRALRLARAKADEWHLNPARIGVMGSSSS